uniref:Uncharacterized protein n=1 Tax=Kalanchoe fedtschenkoi TaxID=63787 RepID=A0A7N0R871_KALFE
MEEGLDKDMVDAGSQKQEDQHTVDVGGLNGHNPNETVESVNENLVLTQLGNDKDDDLLNEETVPAISVGDDAKVETSIITTAYDAGNEVGKMAAVNDREMIEADESATEDESIVFIRELESFYRERAMEFKPPKFYGEPLDCLKLWRAVIQLGGYDRVTGAKLWRQVGESFNPPKTCTTVSWTFRIFYEKALLEYEKHKREIGELEPVEATIPESTMGDSEPVSHKTPGSGRARRDSATRAMQGWHTQRDGIDDAGEPMIKERNSTPAVKREKNPKSVGSIKQKKSANVEQTEGALVLAEGDKQLDASVVDLGPPADWVKISVRETKDCFEIYVLVPGLLREEVRVQSDPAGRVVITGQPEQLDNPWGITPFKKVVNLPARIDPLQTSAVVSVHGRLFVRVPFEQ